MFRGPALVAVLMLTGCGHSTPAPVAPPGTVHGHIVLSGGPPGASNPAAAGTVVIRRDGAEVRRAEVANGQEFTVALAPGSYRLQVTGLGDGCDPVAVTVSAGADQAVDLVCLRK